MSTDKQAPPDPETLETMPVVREQGMIAPPPGVYALAQLSDEDFAARLSLMVKGRERVQAIQRAVMRDGVHFGKVPGTDRYALLKPGQEVLCQLYNYVCDCAPTVAYGDPDNRESPAVRVQVRCEVHAGALDGPVIGVGYGACNSWEIKYRYRVGKRTCPSCGKATLLKSKFPPKGRPKSHPPGWWCNNKKAEGCGADFEADDPRVLTQQVGRAENEDAQDLENTLLKMAEKRAKVDGTISATGTSDLFTQDVADEDKPTTQPAAAEDDPDAWRAEVAASGPKDRNAAAIDQAIAKVSPRAARADHDISDRPDSLEAPNFGLRNLARARFEDVMAAEVKAHRRNRFYLRDSADWKRDNGRQHLADLLGLMIGRDVAPDEFNSLTAEEWDKAAHRLDEYGQQLAEKASQKASEASALAPGSRIGPSQEPSATDGPTDGGAAARGGAASGAALPPEAFPKDARAILGATVRKLWGFPNSKAGYRQVLERIGLIHKQMTNVPRAFLRLDMIPNDLAEEMLAWLEARQTPSREELETRKGAAMIYEAPSTSEPDMGRGANP